MEQQFEIINKLGLHARAAAKLVGVVRKFRASIKVTKDGKQVSGDSLMGLMTLCASQGTFITVTADGSDAEQALSAIENLIKNRFDEAE